MDGVKVELDVRASQSLALEGLRNEISRQIQVARKDADLQLQERPSVVFTSSDEYILAAARLNIQYFLDECMLDTLVVMQGENHIQLRGKVYPYSTQKWHTPVGIENGELYFARGKLYPHYWAALEAWSSNEKETA